MLKLNCCGKDCNVLLKNIKNTSDKCHNLFRKLHLDNVDSEGKIISDTICSKLEEKKKTILDMINSDKAHSGKKIKSILKNSKSVSKNKSKSIQFRGSRSRTRSTVGQRSALRQSVSGKGIKRKNNKRTKNKKLKLK